MNRHRKTLSFKRVFPTTLVAATLTILGAPGAAGQFSSVHIAAGPGGYWVQDGTKVIAYGVPQHGDLSERGAAIASIRGQDGYFVVGVTGNIFNFGSAPTLSCANLRKCSGYDPDPHFSKVEIAVAAATPTGKGLWVVDTDGKVWTVGDAQSHGDVAGQVKKTKKHPKFLPIGIQSSPSGNGYLIVLNTGDVYAFGDATSRFFGSSGGKAPDDSFFTGFDVSRDVSGDIDGYWMITVKGKVLRYGAAPELGDAPGGREVQDIASSFDGRSYAWVDADDTPELESGPADVTIAGNGLALTAPSSDESYASLQEPTAKALGQHWQLWNVAHAGVYDDVQIYNRNNGLCLTIDPKDFLAYLRTCKSEAAGRDYQLFKLSYNGDGSAGIQLNNNPWSSLQPANGVYVMLAQAQDNIYHWGVTPVGEKLAITSAISGQVLGAQQGNQQLFASATSSERQQWTFRPAAGNTVQMINSSTGECVQVPANDVNTPLDTASCFSSPAASSNQSWYVLPSGKGTMFAPAGHPAYRLSLNRKSHTIELVKYDPERGDPSILWTVSDQNDASPAQPNSN